VHQKDEDNGMDAHVEHEGVVGKVNHSTARALHQSETGESGADARRES